MKQDPFIRRTHNLVMSLTKVAYEMHLDCHLSTPINSKNMQNSTLFSFSMAENNYIMELNPLVHAATHTVHTTGCCMHKAVKLLAVSSSFCREDSCRTGIIMTKKKTTNSRRDQMLHSENTGITSIHLESTSRLS